MDKPLTDRLLAAVTHAIYGVVFGLTFTGFLKPTYNGGEGYAKHKP